MIRRSSTISVYDYPEHLNPFREERRESIGNKFRSFGQRGSSFRNAWNLLLPRSKRSQSFSRNSSASPPSNYDTWTVSRPSRSHHEAIGLPASWTISPRRRYTPPSSEAGSPPPSPSLRGSQISVATLGTDTPASGERFQWQGARPKKRRAPLPPISPTGSGSASSHTSSSTSLRNARLPDDTKAAERESLQVLVSRIQQEFGDGQEPGDPARVTTTSGSSRDDKASVQAEKAFVIEHRLRHTPPPGGTAVANNSIANENEVPKAESSHVSNISREAKPEDDGEQNRTLTEATNDSTTSHEQQEVTIHELEQTTLQKPQKATIVEPQETPIHEPQNTPIHESQEVNVQEPSEVILQKTQEVIVHDPLVANNVFVETTSRTISSDGGNITLTTSDGEKTSNSTDLENSKHIKEQTLAITNLPENQASSNTIGNNDQRSDESRVDSYITHEAVNTPASEIPSNESQVESVGAFVVSTPDTASVYEDAASEVDSEEPIATKTTDDNVHKPTLQDENLLDSSKIIVDKSFGKEMPVQTETETFNEKSSFETSSKSVKPIILARSNNLASRTQSIIIPRETPPKPTLNRSNTVDSKTPHENVLRSQVSVQDTSGYASKYQSPGSVLPSNVSSFKVTLKNERRNTEATRGSESPVLPRKDFGARTNGDIRRTPTTAPRIKPSNGLPEQSSSSAEAESPTVSTASTPTPPPRNKPQPVPRMKRLRKLFSN